MFSTNNTNQRLRLCILTETYYPVVGGGETQTRTLVCGLSEKDQSVKVLTRRSDPGFKKIEQQDGAVIYRLPPVGQQHLKKWGLLPTSLLELFRLRDQYDLIFVSGFRVLGVGAVIAAKLLGKKCVLKADSLGEMSGDFFAGGLEKLGFKTDSRPFRIFLGIRNSALRQADGFVAISSAISDELIKNNVVPSRIYRIPNSVDSERFHPVTEKEKLALRKKLNLPLERTIVTYTGRLVSYKGLPLLLRVWLKIVTTHKKANLLLVGSGGLDIHNCESELKSFVKKNNITEQVIFTGAVENVHEYLQASDIFVFPSENEAFGISVVEAMACRLPVVTTPIGGLKDIIKDSIDGLVIEVDHDEQLYDALEKLMTDCEFALRIGHAAREAAEERYNTNVINKQYFKLFNQLLYESP